MISVLQGLEVQILHSCIAVPPVRQAPTSLAACGGLHASKQRHKKRCCVLKSTLKSHQSRPSPINPIGTSTAGRCRHARACARETLARARRRAG
jgi:hypothetical protein